MPGVSVGGLKSGVVFPLLLRGPAGCFLQRDDVSVERAQQSTGTANRLRGVVGVVVAYKGRLERDGLRIPRLSHKNFTRLSNASNLLGQSVKSSSAS
jgi:hypothetical protein